MFYSNKNIFAIVFTLIFLIQPCQAEIKGYIVKNAKIAQTYRHNANFFADTYALAWDKYKSKDFKSWEQMTIWIRNRNELQFSDIDVKTRRILDITNRYLTRGKPKTKQQLYDLINGCYVGWRKAAIGAKAKGFDFKE